MRLARIRTTSVRASFCLIVLLALSSVAFANTVTVGCSGAPAGAYDYSTVNAALAALSSNNLNPNTIIVSGTCYENLQVHGWRYLTITGTPGARLTAPPVAVTNNGVTLYVANSIAFSLRSIIVDGPDASSYAFWAAHSSGDAYLVTFQNALVGANFTDLSDFHLVSVLVQDNTDAGVGVGSSIVSFDNTESIEPVSSTIQRSGTGILAGEHSTVHLWGSTTVQNNEFAGIQMDASTLNSCCDPGTRSVHNNGFGIRLLNGSSATLRGIDVTNNTLVGLQLIGSSAQVIGRHNISNTTTAGLGVAVRSSHLELRNGHVDNNGAIGMVIRENGSVRMQNEVVSGNGTGVQAMLLSTVGVIGGSITGNGTDLVCSPESFAFGDKPVIGTLKCPSFGIDPLPGNPSK